MNEAHTDLRRHLASQTSTHLFDSVDSQTDDVINPAAKYVQLTDA